MATDHKDAVENEQNNTSFVDRNRGKIIQTAVVLIILAGLSFAFLGPKNERNNVSKFFSDCVPVNGVCK